MIERDNDVNGGGQTRKLKRMKPRFGSDIIFKGKIV